MFQRKSDEVFRASALDAIPWVRHGFGTRLSTGWPSADTVNLATVKQIHSDRVLLVDSAGVQGEGDAMISRAPGLALAIRTADCLPILMADPRNRAVAAIHAGWRGVVSEIAPKAIQAMRRQFGTRPEDLVIAIGPGIGPCCFEVGPDVSVQFGMEARAKVDLVETTRRQLGRNGVPDQQICASGLCSYCNATLFESYRRDREAAGRMIAVIAVTAEN